MVFASRQKSEINNMTVLLAWNNVGQMGIPLVQRQQLSTNLPVYIFLGGLVISQKFKTPLQRQKHEVQLA